MGWLSFVEHTLVSDWARGLAIEVPFRLKCKYPTPLFILGPFSGTLVNPGGPAFDDVSYVPFLANGVEPPPNDARIVKVPWSAY